MPEESREILSRPAPPPTRTERFGSEPHQVYDVYEPPVPGPHGRPAPSAVVLVHGGFWRSGYDRTHLGPLAAALAGAGWSVARLEYRGTGADGGGWPHTLDDVRAGLATVRSEGADFAAPVLVGHSAGGHLALCLLHRSEGRGVAGAVSLAGCVDLGLVARLRLGDGAAQALIGGEPAEAPEAMAALDPVALGPPPVPVVLVHGAGDEVVPPVVSRSWLEQAGAAGRDRLVELPECGHFGLIDPEHAAFPTLLTAIREVAGRAAASRVVTEPHGPDGGGV